MPQATTTTLIEGTTRLPPTLMSDTYMVVHFFQGFLAHKYFMLVMYLFLVYCFSSHTHVYTKGHLNTHIYYVRLPNFVNKKQGGSCDNTTPSQQQLSALNFDDRRNFRSQKWQQLMRTFFCIVYGGCAVRLL